MNEDSKPTKYVPPKMPVIRNIEINDVISAVKEGITDFTAAPSFGLFFGAIYAIGGLAILAFLTIYDQTWMIIPIAIGFPLIGPFVAVGLYEVSRRLEVGKPLVWKEILTVVIQQRERQFGWMAFVILCIFWIWLFQVRILFAIFLGFQSFPSVNAFVKVVITTPEGFGFLAVGTVIGAIMAFVLYASTVVAIPLLLDRDIDVVSALITSFQAVLQNRNVMLGWGICVAILLVLAMLPAFIGMIVVLPILGHTTWHLFEKVIEKAE